MIRPLGRLGLALVVFATLLSPGFADESASRMVMIDGKSVQLARYPRAYVGEGNVTIYVATYAIDPAHQGALLKFSGIESPWDGKVVAHIIKNEGYDNSSYIAQFNNRDWYTLRISHGGESIWFFAPEGPRDGQEVYSSDKAAKTITTQAIYDAYAKGSH